MAFDTGAGGRSEIGKVPIPGGPEADQFGQQRANNNLNRNSDADRALKLRMQGADLQTQRDINTQNTEAQKSVAGANIAGQDRASDKQYWGNINTSKIQADASKYPATLKQDRFNQVFPWLQGQFGALSHSLNGDRVGGQSGGSPEISVGPVWNSQQIQGRVNDARASNDATTQTNINNMQQSMGGKGFGSNSPLAQALGVQMQGQNMANNTQAENDLRWNSAQGNADQITKTQGLREQQFAARNQEDIARRQALYNNQNTLISALSGIVS